MRLFVAVCFNEKVMDYRPSESGIEEGLVMGKLYSLENLHLTLVFLGDLTRIS